MKRTSEGPGTSSSLSLSPARMRDAARIAAMSRDHIEHGLGWSWRPERVARAVRDADTMVLRAGMAGSLAGFAIMRFGDDEANLDLLAVMPARRRRGVARALLDWLECSALTAGMAVVRLEVRASNGGAIRFYEAMGYRSVATAHGYYQGQEDALRMARDLHVPPR